MTRRTRQAPIVVDSVDVVRTWLSIESLFTSRVRTIRGQLQRYLAAGDVARFQPGEEAMTVGEIRGRSTQDIERLLRAAEQALIDELLQRVLDGEDPRTVFALEKRRRGPKNNPAREIAASLEVARLMARHGMSMVESVGEVAAAPAFGVADVRTIDRWCKRWDVSADDVAEYEAQLRAAGLL